LDYYRFLAVNMIKPYQMMDNSENTISFVV